MSLRVDHPDGWVAFRDEVFVKKYFNNKNLVQYWLKEQQ